MNTAPQNTPQTGRFLGMPYDWRRITWQRIKDRIWNPNDHRIFTPKAWGWAWDINFFELLRRLHLVGR